MASKVVSGGVKTIKFYLHHEAEPEFVMVVYWDVNRLDNIREICNMFAEELSKRTCLEVRDDDVTIFSSKRKKLSLDAQVTNVIRDKDDVYASWSKPKYARHIEKYEKRRAERECREAFENHPSCQTIAVQLESITHIHQVIEEAKRGARGAPYSLTVKMKKKGQRDQVDTEGAYERDGVYNLSRRAKVKELEDETTMDQDEYQKQLSDARSRISTDQIREGIEILYDILKKRNDDLTVLEDLVSFFLDCGRPKKAKKYADQLSEAHPSYCRRKYYLGRCQLALGNGKDSSLLLFHYLMEDMKDSEPMDHVAETKMYLTRALVLNGNDDLAFPYVHSALLDIPSYAKAITEYADLMAKLSEHTSRKTLGMKLLVHNLIHNGDMVDLQERLSKAVQRPGGMDLLKMAIDDFMKNVKVLLYIGNVLYRYGAIKQAKELYFVAMCEEEKNIYAAFFMLQACIMEDNNVIAFKMFKSFCKKNPGLRAGELSCSRLSPLLANMPPGGEFYIWNDLTGTAWVDLEARPMKRFKTEEDHQLFAFFCTFVRLLFCKGCLRIVKQFVKLIDPVWLNRDLENTSIWSDVMTFSLISHNMKTITEMPLLNNFTQFIFMVGDNHVIPPAWKSVNFKEVQHIIHPVFVPGVKLWHLRDETTYYKKVLFWNALRKLPDDSIVMFCMGELDCIYPLLDCVDKLRYDKIEGAIDKIQRIYVSIVTKLVKERNWTIFIHPIPSAGRGQRVKEVFTKFNQRLKLRVDSEPSLHWLDLFTNSHESPFRDQYVLDSNHLKPSYVELIQQHLPLTTPST